MELRITDLSKPQRVEIKYNGESFNPQVFISVKPWDSKDGQKVKSDLIREMMKLREVKDYCDEEGKPKPEFVTELSINAVAALTTGWEGVKDEKGKPLPFNDETCRKVYTDYPFIFAQVDSFSSNLGNFQKA